MKKLIVLATILAVITSTFTVGTNVNATSDQERLLNLINNYRQSNGLSVLTARNDVTAVATAHSKNMHDQNNLNHVLDGKSPSDRLNDAGIGYTAMVENVAFNKGYSDPIQTCFDGWVNSPGHNANMLSSNVTHAGIGIHYSEARGWWFTFMGIKPTGSDQQPDPGEGEGEEEEDSQDINLTLKQGASNTYSITFTNTGNVALTMKTTIVSGSKWIVVTPATVTIPVGKKQIFSVKISAFTDMAPGKYNDTVKFSWNGGTSNYNINLTVIQNPDLVKPDFQISAQSTLTIPFEQGACATIAFTIKNTGSTDINPLAGVYTSPLGFLKLFPNQAPKTGVLKPGESVTINLGVMMLVTTANKSVSAFFTFTEKTLKKTFKVVLYRDNSPLFTMSGPQLIKMDFVGKSKTFNYSITNTGRVKSTFDFGIWFDDYDFLTVDYTTTADEIATNPGKTATLKVTFTLLKKPTVNIVSGYIQCNKTGNTAKKNLEFRLIK